MGFDGDGRTDKVSIAHLRMSMAALQALRNAISAIELPAQSGSTVRNKAHGRPKSLVAADRSPHTVRADPYVVYSRCGPDDGAPGPRHAGGARRHPVPGAPADPARSWRVRQLSPGCSAELDRRRWPKVELIVGMFHHRASPRLISGCTALQRCVGQEIRKPTYRFYEGRALAIHELRNKHLVGT